MNRLVGVGRTVLPGLGVGVVAASLPYWLITQQYVLSVVMVAMIYAIAAQGWNIIGGYGGLLSFGHSVFFGIGAYTTALLTVRLGITPWIGMFIGAAVAAVVGAILTFPALRLRGVYFTLATFVLSLLVTDLAVHFREFTGGDQGLSLPFTRNNPLMFQFDSSLTLYFVLVAFLAGATLVVAFVARSRLGLFLRATRDDPDAALASGVNVTRTRLFGLMISAAITSIAGSLMLEYLRFIDPATGLGANTAFIIGLVALVGGRGTVLGPVIGAAVLIPAQQILSSTFAAAPAGLSGMAYAAIVVAIMIVDWRGLHHLISRLIGSVRRSLRHRPTGDLS
ncbi:branched-chain amino acid ABC transporter permease [Lysinimonas soli]|uniref:Branched-chain amino acid ABC transporter permease n=1 Tax=Lysinimonas soli TaxID=1074233 RepID=A0ABW0NUB7_9MICO